MIFNQWPKGINSFSKCFSST